MSESSRPKHIPSTAWRFAAIIRDLSGAAGMRMRADPATVPKLSLLQAWLHNTIRRFVALAQRAKAGPLPPPRPRAPRPAPGRPEPTPHPPRPRQPEMPRQFLWVVRLLGVEATGCANQLDYLLKDPEMQALLRDAPQVGRILRPLYRRLGRKPDPALLPPPPPRPPRAKPPPPEPDPAAPVPTEPAEKPFRKRPLRTEARTRKPKWTYPGTEWRKWGGFWFPGPIRKPT